MSPQRAARAVLAYRAALAARLVDARLKAAADVLDEAQKISSGTVSLAEMARRDHPKAVRHGTPMMPLLPVNKHKGDFYRAWHVELGANGSLRVVNDSKVAGWLDEGTSKMFAHHITPYLQSFADSALLQRIDEALRS